jgi:hypothetical protein
MGGKTDFINKEGKYVINPQFDTMDKFFDGLAKVNGSNKTGYIDKDGKYVWNLSN